MIIHFTHDGSPYPSCGLPGGTKAFITDDPAEVTCKRCLACRSFIKRHPNLAVIDSNVGRPRAAGIQRTFKVFLSPNLDQWLRSQPTQAEAIVSALKKFSKITD
jgi:hypothetical protein